MADQVVAALGDHRAAARRAAALRLHQRLIEGTVDLGHQLPSLLVGDLQRPSRRGDRPFLGDRNITHRFITRWRRRSSVKELGFGREGGIEGLQGYTVVKNVSHLMT
jgi:hypothetical protein